MFIWWRGSFQKMDGGGAEEVRILEKRAHVQDVCAQLRQSFPSVPLLHEFQVGGKYPSTWYPSQWGQFQADIIACAVDWEDPSHILSCLRATGKVFPCSCWASSCCRVWRLNIPRGTHWNAPQKRLTCTIFFSQPVITAGSITVPLTSLGEQLKNECNRLGLSAVVGGWGSCWRDLTSSSALLSFLPLMRWFMFKFPTGFNIQNWYIHVFSDGPLHSDETVKLKTLSIWVSWEKSFFLHCCTTQSNMFRQGTSYWTVTFPHLDVNQSFECQVICSQVPQLPWMSVASGSGNLTRWFAAMFPIWLLK